MWLAAIASLAQQIDAVFDGSIRGEPTARQRCGSDRIEITERCEVATVLDRRLLGVATIEVEARLGGVRADHLETAIALHTVAAAPGCVDHHGSEFGVHAGDFVAEHHRQRTREHTLDHVQVGVADAAGGDVDQLRFVGDNGIGMVLDELERSIDAGRKHGTHRHEN